MVVGTGSGMEASMVVGMATGMGSGLEMEAAIGMCAGWKLAWCWNAIWYGSWDGINNRA